MQNNARDGEVPTATFVQVFYKRDNGDGDDDDDNMNKN